MLPTKSKSQSNIFFNKICQLSSLIDRYQFTLSTYTHIASHTHRIVHQTMTKTKILVLHPNPDNLDTIIKKANLQHEKNGPFEAVILLGSHAISPCSTQPQVPLYYSSEDTETQQDNYIPVTGAFSRIKLKSGLKLGFLNQSGAECPEEVDILVSFHWPFAVANSQGLALISDQNVDIIAKQAKPRYHFSVGNEKGRFYEYSSFSWSGTRTCRFISLAQEGSGEKWFYAFAIDPLEADSSADGKNPYTEGRQTILNETPGEPSSERLNPLKRETEEYDSGESKKPRVVAPLDCFFCLSNPKIESHMIVAIGKESYLATAKGPMPLPQRPLDFSGHAIIIPFDHAPILGDLSTQREEMGKFQETVAMAFFEKQFATVFFQISRQENVHIHTQLIPVRLEGAEEQFEKALAERTRQNNERATHNQHLKFTSDPKEVKEIIQTNNFIRFVLSMGDRIKVYAAELEPGRPVDLQFPRRVMAYHLKCPKRTYWDRCKQTKGQETTECERFKSFYRKYDFTS